MVIARAVLTAWLVLAVAGGTLPATAGPLDRLTFYTEHYPPNQYREDGRLKGALVEIVSAVFDAADTRLTRADIKLVPWSRGYRRTLERPNTVLFGTVRTPMRADKFRWVGPLAPTAQVVIGPRAVGHSPDSLADFNDYTTITVRDDVAEQLLRAGGVSRANLLRVNKTDLIPRILQSDRATFWAYGRRVAFHILEAAGIAERYEVVHTLREGALYFALNKDTDPEAVRALREALAAVKRSGEHAEILARYR